MTSRGCWDELLQGLRDVLQKAFHAFWMDIT